MNLPRFAEIMNKNLHIIETETIYFENGEQKYAHLNVISAWDDGLVYQMVIHVDAGPVQRFVGYSDEADEKRRVWAQNEEAYDGLEDALSQAIRRDWMYGDFILLKLEESDEEIVWRYPRSGDHTPATLEELYALKDKENVWFRSDYDPSR